MIRVRLITACITYQKFPLRVGKKMLALCYAHEITNEIAGPLIDEMVMLKSAKLLHFTYITQFTINLH